MGSKTEPGKFDCYDTALPDEPMFILLARDVHAPLLVRAWAGIRLVAGESALMIREAHECAFKMEEWRMANNGIWRRKL